MRVVADEMVLYFGLAVELGLLKSVKYGKLVVVHIGLNLSQNVYYRLHFLRRILLLQILVVELDTRGHCHPNCFTGTAQQSSLSSPKTKYVLSVDC